MGYQLNHRFWDFDFNKEVFFNGTNNVDAFGFLANYPIFGNTNNRPNPKTTEKGFRYFDTDLNKTVTWDGTDWVDVTAWTTIE